MAKSGTCFVQIIEYNMDIVNDMFFEFERGQKLGMWVLAVDSGLLLGPACTIILQMLS